MLNITCQGLNYFITGSLYLLTKVLNKQINKQMCVCVCREKRERLRKEGNVDKSR